MGKKVKKGVKGFFGGVKKAVQGVADIVVGVVTLDVEKIGQGFGGVVLGVTQAVTFGGFQPDLQKNEPIVAAMEGRKTMARGSETPRKIAYGRPRVGGQLVFFESTGPDSQFMNMIVVLAPHEVEGIDEIYFNDDLAYTADGVATPQFWGKAANNITKVLGNQTGAISAITSIVPSWTEAHKLLGCAFIHVRLIYDKDLYSRGMPNVSAIVRGKKLWNPATNTTAYSRNHALVCLDYLQSDLGFRATADEIDLQSFIDGAAICDQQVQAATGTEPRYTVDGVVSLADSPVDNLDALARAGAAVINYVQGKFVYVPGAYSAPVMDFDESDLIGGISVITGLSKSQLINTAKGTYIDARLDFEPADFVPITIQSYKDLDGEELLADMPMQFASSATLARRLAKIAIETSRYGVTASVTFKFKALRLTVGDRITLSISRFGWDNRVFRVDSMGASLTGGITCTLREDAPAVWGWDQSEAIDINIPPPLNLPPRAPMAAPTNVVATEQINTPLTATGDTSTILLTSTPPSDSRLSHIRYQMRLQGLDEWQDAGYQGQTQASFQVPSNGATYEFRAQAVSQVGVISEEAGTTTLTVTRVTGNAADSAGGTVTPPPVITVPPIKRLELINQAGEWNEFKSPNAEFQWAKLSTTRGGSITSLSGDMDLHFAGYKVRISTPQGKLLREEITQDAYYEYSYDKNKKDNNGQAIRSFKIEVAALTTVGYMSELNGFVVSNPAPAAPSGVAFSTSFTTIGISFNLPDDVDFVGVDLFVIEGAGNPYTATPTRISGNTATLEGLNQNTLYTIGLRSVDQFGTGGQIAAVGVTTQDLGAADVTGLGVWATLTDPADLAFIQANLNNDAIPSEKIGSVVAGKITAGQIDVTVDVGTGVRLDGANGVVQTVNSGYKTTMGAHTIGGDTYVMSAADGSTVNFGLLPDGSGKFGQLSLGANGSITSPSFTIAANGDATFSGTLSAASGTFAGSLSAASGTFAGELQAATGTFSGNLSAAGGTFSGDLSAAGGTFSGTLSGVDGDFSGTLSAATGTITNVNATNLNVSGTSTFGDVSADQFMQFTGSELIFGNKVSVQPTATAGDNFDSIPYGGNAMSIQLQPASVLFDISTHNYGFINIANSVVSSGSLIQIFRTDQDSSASNVTAYQTFTALSGISPGSGAAARTLLFNPKNGSVRRYYAIASGSVRVSLTQVSQGSTTCFVAVFVNNSQISEWSLLSGANWAFASRSVDISVKASDFIDIKVRSSSSSSSAVPFGAAYNIRFRTQSQRAAVIPVPAL